MKKTIAVITGTRAEYGLLRNLLILIKNSDFLNLHLYVTGTHLSKKYGLTEREIIKDGIDIHKKVNININFDDSFAISSSISKGLDAFAKNFKLQPPDLLIVLGDRYELLSGVIPAYFANIPIAHIHGGETTEGALDESIRHSITKFSSIHFVATEVYKKRVIQLGENPSKVFNVGGMGIDAIASTKLLSKEELEKKLKIKIKSKSLIVTYHPETSKISSVEKDIKELIKSLRELKDTTLIITSPNADIDNLKIINSLNDFSDRNPNVHFFKSLGQKKFFSLLSIVDGVVGNSSSGLLEAPYFKKGTVNIGDRQKGRLKTASIIDCETNSHSISQAISRLYSKEFQKKINKIKNIYGDKGASQRIFDLLEKFDYKNLIEQKFFDVEFKI